MKRGLNLNPNCQFCKLNLPWSVSLAILMEIREEIEGDYRLGVIIYVVATVVCRGGL